MTQSLILSAEIARQALGLPGPIVPTESYCSLPCTPPGSPLTGKVKSDSSHAGFVLTGPKALRDAAIAAFAKAYPAGLTLGTAYGLVTGSLEADPHGDRFAIGRWSFKANGIHFAQDTHVEKSVAHGLLMAEVARALCPLVAGVIAAARPAQVAA